MKREMHISLEENGQLCELCYLAQLSSSATLKPFRSIHSFWMFNPTSGASVPLAEALSSAYTACLLWH